MRVERHGSLSSPNPGGVPGRLRWSPAFRRSGAGHRLKAELQRRPPRTETASASAYPRSACRWRPHDFASAWPKPSSRAANPPTTSTGSSPPFGRRRISAAAWSSCPSAWTSAGLIRPPATSPSPFRGRTSTGSPGRQGRPGSMSPPGLVERAGPKLFNAAVLIGPAGELLLHHRKINELDIALDLYSVGDRVGVAQTDLGTFGLTSPPTISRTRSPSATCSAGWRAGDPLPVRLGGGRGPRQRQRPLWQALAGRLHGVGPALRRDGRRRQQRRPVDGRAVGRAEVHRLFAGRRSRRGGPGPRAVRGNRRGRRLRGHRAAPAGGAARTSPKPFGRAGTPGPDHFAPAGIVSHSEWSADSSRAPLRCADRPGKWGKPCGAASCGRNRLPRAGRGRRLVDLGQLGLLRPGEQPGPAGRQGRRPDRQGAGRRAIGPAHGGRTGRADRHRPAAPASIWTSGFRFTPPERPSGRAPLRARRKSSSTRGPGSGTRRRSPRSAATRTSAAPS